MKKILLIFTLCFMILTSPVHAARFGGGKSFGQHSSSRGSSTSRPQQQQHQQQQPHPQNTPAPPKSSFASKILPALAGLSIGAMLGSMLSGNGLGGGMGGILMMLAAAGLVFFLVRKLLSSKGNAKNFNSYQNTNPQNDVTQNQTLSGNTYQGLRDYSASQNYAQPVTNNSLSFKQEEFLRTAKTTFIRMQNAYDTKNLSDISTFTTPEVFGEIQMQIQERGNTNNFTEVILINSSFLDGFDADNTTATVLFSGKIREELNAQPIDINEIWHFVKNDKNNWLIAGIEQKN